MSNLLTPEPARTPTASHFPAELKLMNTPAGLKRALKHRDHEAPPSWQLGWWDLDPLTSGRKPPLQWTSSSVILSAHATEPQVVCLHFPSNRQFSIPSPPPLQSSPTSYEPPTTIVASSRDNLIFAYFPGVDCDGVGCLWRKGPQIDNWVVKEWWTFPRGAGVVSARWQESDRQWVASDAGIPTRLPMLGPMLPLLNPVLIVVTESHLCYLYYLHPQTDSVRVLAASLRRKSFLKDGDERHPGEQTEGPRGMGSCIRAAIGFGYDESSIVIATQSIPLPGSNWSPSDSKTEASTAMPIPSSSTESTVSVQWDAWSAENIIELCEITISTQGILLSLTTNPMAPVRNYPSASSILTEIVFIPALPNTHQAPSTPILTNRNVTPVSSPALSNAHISQSSPGRAGPLKQPMQLKGSSAKIGLEKSKGGHISVLYLLCASVDVCSYTGKPKSDLTLFTLMRGTARSEPSRQLWLHKRQSAHTYRTNVIAYLRPYQPSSSPQQLSVLVGFLNSEGPVQKAKDSNHVEVGEFKVLRLPDLQADETWESSKMIVKFGSEGVLVPLGFTVSPNHTLIGSVSSSLMRNSTSTSTTIHNHPAKSTPALEGGVFKSRKQYAISLGMAVQKRATPNDILRSLSPASVPLQVIEDILAAVMLEGELNSNGVSQPSLAPIIYDIIGLAVDVYRQKAFQSKIDAEKEDCEARSIIGHDICSMVYCNRAWEDCMEGDGYDLDAIWNLLGLSAWTIELLEKILKEIVLFSSETLLLDCIPTPLIPEGASSGGPNSVNGDLSDPFEIEMKRGAATTDKYYNLMHLAHPFPLESLINLARHVARLRMFLSMISAKSDLTRMAKEMLLDTVDSSGINLELVVKALMEARTDVRSYSDRAPDIPRRCLVALKPQPIHRPLLKKIAATLSNAVDKPRLFIRPEDFVDNMDGLSLSPIEPMKRQARDVITKRYLANGTRSMTCLRCNRKTEIPTSPVGPPCRKWLAYERSWATHCICGGLWISKA